jgi:hypothetical protein
MALQNSSERNGNLAFTHSNPNSEPKELKPPWERPSWQKLDPFDRKRMLLILREMEGITREKTAAIDEQLEKFQDIALDSDWIAFAITAGNGDIERCR